MPRKFRRYKKYSKKRQYRRKFSRYGRMKKSVGNPRQKVYYYKRFCVRLAVLAGNVGNDTFASYLFTLDQLPGYTEFTSMYDAYKFCAAKIRFLPSFNQQIADSTTTTTGWSTFANLRIFSVIDYNDATTPVSINDLRQYSNCKMSPYTKGHRRYFKPRYLEDNAVTLFTGKNPWLSTTRPDIGHYGIKLGIDTSLIETGLLVPADVLLRVECTYYVAFKSPN